MHFVEQQLAPVIRRLPGYRGYYPGINQETGRHCSVTLWESREQAQALRDVLGAT